MEAKKRKIEATVQESDNMKFSDLNDDVIDKILSKLPPDDLCSMSFVNKRLQRLAQDNCSRNYRDTVFVICDRKISDGDADRYVPGFTPKYANYFSKFIKNIVIEVEEASFADCWKLIKKECSPELKSLRITHLVLVNDLTYSGKIIKDQLSSIQSIDIRNLSGNDIKNLHNGLLQYCGEIKSLHIKESFPVSDYGKQLIHNYPNLTELSLSGNSSAEVGTFRGLQRFIQMNPQLENIDIPSYLMENTLLSCDRIKSLRLDFAQVDSFTAVSEAAKASLQNKPIEIFEISFGGITFLPEFDKIQPIHRLTTHLLQQDDLNRLNMLQSLQSLHLYIYIEMQPLRLQPLLTGLSKLPFLERLYLDVDKEQVVEQEKFEEIIEPLVRRSTKLAEVSLYFDRNTLMDRQYSDFGTINVAELSRARQQVERAVKMTFTVCLPRPLPNIDIPDGSFVKIVFKY